MKFSNLALKVGCESLEFQEVYRSPNGKSGHYIERSFNPRAQKQSNKRKQDKYTENSLNPHFHEKYPHPSK
jgi:hypothetical protein